MFTIVGQTESVILSFPLFPREDGSEERKNYLDNNSYYTLKKCYMFHRFSFLFPHFRLLQIFTSFQPCAGRDFLVAIPLPKVPKQTFTEMPKYTIPTSLQHPSCPIRFSAPSWADEVSAFLEESALPLHDFHYTKHWKTFILSLFSILPIFFPTQCSLEYKEHKRGI